VRAALELRVTWSGYEAIDTERQYIVLALHESFVDVPLLAALPLDLRFTAREELFANEDFGALLRSSHHISIPETRSPSSIRLLVARLRAAVAAGDSIVVFPQGSLLGVEVAFQPGAWRLAQMLALPVLPVASREPTGCGAIPSTTRFTSHAACAQPCSRPSSRRIGARTAHVLPRDC
jgi:1-acyl-sn-glycerol-3-phosphate acyltransferase